MKTNTGVCLEWRNGELFASNPNLAALHAAANALEGAAEGAGIMRDEELAELVHEASAELWAERQAHIG